VNEKRILADRNEEIVTAKFAGHLNQSGVGQASHLSASQILEQFAQILEQIVQQVLYAKSRTECVVKMRKLGRSHHGCSF
jgi:hypothetical protein